MAVAGGGTIKDQPLLNWIEHREVFLLEMLHHDGRGDSSSSCSACGINPSLYCCKDCFMPMLSCQTCIVQAHTHLLKWNGKCFQNFTLRDLGLHVQLGHKVGKSCLLPNQAFNDNFVLIDILGIHSIAVDFCGCSKAQSHMQQLLRVGWFPVTTTNLRTAATFCILQQFHILSFESKVSAYEFYHSLVCLTDNTGLLKRKDRYDAFMCMAREYHHVKMLKQAGHGHDPSGILATLPGECAVLCLACPQPGKNLPNDWELAPKGTRWLYACFLAINENFRLKRWIVSKDAVDPSLSRGWGYFVNETTYKTYLTSHGMELQEKSTCASHNTMNMVETKSSKGLAAMGLGTIDCTCHNMKLPNGVGDLQKGERYALECIYQHGFFVLFSFTSPLSRKSVGQDGKPSRRLPAQLHNQNCSFFVPKFHLPAHIAKCQTAFSFNWSRWVRHTDGEAPERGWSNINPVASNDHFGDWNWKKVVNLGASLSCKMKEATLEKAAFHVAFEELNNALTEKHCIAWKAKVEKWEDNPNDAHVPNPFEPKSVVITQAGACLKLVQLEVWELERGVDVSLHPEVSPSVFVGLGLDLEEEQFMKSLSNHVTDTQKGNLLHQRNTLHCKIKSWRMAQALYMPVAHDALEEILQCLRIHSSLLTYKKDWVCGQGRNMRAQSALEQVSARQAACTAHYHASWGALNVLAKELGKVGWQGGLQFLEDGDIQPLIDPYAMPGQGGQKLLWIWRMSGVDSGGDGTDEDGVRVEWCKAQAREMRWAEEAKLLHKEMCHVLQFLWWQATWWDEQGNQHVEENEGCLEGIRAYAAKQGNICHTFTDHFQTLWVLSGADHTANLPDLSALPPPDI
ncbi:hypothetical protein DFH29DRAFT_985501 [Suillus ampliporus]|nr:hypothetical protein DFH29DRAFT_985501 [Suillus ampliporus]